ncbi:hypothetical protein BpHYR1_004940 [Brachionus plicatilis]|uniref:Uncharacterized protein n=1 Tax=Brachionus plicatilis TaxID=10195 RepID=A0A3M7S0W5_BRAPC|nr:hypothetical protein BpHYR1_004940 [Brachionus plicatilis]
MANHDKIVVFSVLFGVDISANRNCFTKPGRLKFIRSILSMYNYLKNVISFFNYIKYSQIKLCFSDISLTFKLKRKYQLFKILKSYQHSDCGFINRIEAVESTRFQNVFSTKFFVLNICRQCRLFRLFRSNNILSTFFINSLKVNKILSYVDNRFSRTFFSFLGRVLSMSKVISIGFDSTTGMFSLLSEICSLGSLFISTLGASGISGTISSSSTSSLDFP